MTNRFINIFSRNYGPYAYPRNIQKALFASVLLAMQFSVGGTVVSGNGVTLEPGLEWENVNALPYAEATACLGTHARPMSGWERFTAYVQWRAFMTPAFFARLGCLFAGCVALFWWVRGDSAKWNVVLPAHRPRT